MGLPLIVNTTGLVIVVSGLYVRDDEPRNPYDCVGGGVVEGVGEDVKEGTELVELLSWEVVEGVWDVPEVEGGVVGVNWSVLVFGDWLGVEEGGSEVGDVSDGGAVDGPPSLLGRLKGSSEACLGTRMGAFSVGIGSGGLVK